MCLTIDFGRCNALASLGAKMQKKKEKKGYPLITLDIVQVPPV